MAKDSSMTSIFSSALSQWQDGRDYMYCDLVDAVKSVHQQSFRTAVKAVNRYATMRNWLIGFFIVEYQQKGKDRAAYGENLLKSLEQSLQIRGLNVTLFQNSRLFYSLYPQVGNLFMIKIQPTPSVKSVAEEIQPTASAKLQSDAETIVGKLSFSHLCELIHIGDETTRLFYETECVKCGWSVRELRRFITTNLHIRVGMSQNPNAVIASLPSNNNMSALDIRQPYTFEFLGLKATEVLKESDIEEALLSHLQQFLLEMGKGFCFEDRQKRMIIDDEYYYADWAFCYVQRRVKRWLNMPSLAWITICLFQPTFCNCQINRCWRNLSKIIKVKQFEKFCMIQDMTHNMYKDIVRMTAMTARIVLTGLILLMTGGNAAAQGVHVEGNVFGGGNLADVGGNVTVNISAGTVDKDVYGGGAKANTNTDNWNFDGGTEYVQVNVIVDETVVTGMYTESGGTYTQIIAEGTKAVGNTTYYKKVGVWKESSGTTGGYIAATETTPSSTYYKTTVNLLGGTITGNAYGGGLGEGQGATGTPAYVYGDVKVNLNGLEAATDVDATTLTSLTTGTNARLNATTYKVISTLKGCAVTKVFGCNNLNGTPKGHVKVNVYATQNANATAIYPKTNSHTAQEETGTTTTYDVTAVYGGGNLSPYDPVDAYSTNNDVKLAAKTEVLIDGCGLTSIKQVYGGGNAASAPATYVRVDGTFEIEELFGGGNGNDDYQFNGKWYKNPGANVGYTNYTHLDGNGDGSTASPYTCVDNDNAKTKAGRQTEANGYMYGSGIAQIEVFGGKIFASYGGSNKKGNVRVEARSKYEEAGDCALNVVETYGGGKDSEIDGVINLNVGCVKNMDQIFGGSKNAPVYSDIVLNIHNGHYHQVFGGNNTSGAIHGSITVNIEEKGCVPIDIDELYIGGYLAPYSIYGYKNDGTPLKEGDTGALETPYKQPRLNVISASRIGDIFGGGYQATVVGDPHVNVNMEAGKVEVKKTEITAADAATDEYAFSESDKYYIYTYKYYTSATAYTEYKVKNDVISNISGKYYAPLTLGTIENVYGGGNEANIVGDTYVEIGTGKWLKDGTDDVWETKDDAGNTYTFEKKGSDTAPKWYKGDDAQESAPTPRRKAAKISGDVFGGGQGVNTGDATDVDIAKVEGNTNIQFDNGTIAKSVYGGGKLAQVSGTTTINITGGTATTVIGTTGEGGATYGNVYGGGFGHTADKLFGRIMGNTNVNISGGAILHNVYGGGAYGSVGTFSYDTAEMPSGLSTASTGTTNVTITGGTIGTNGDENGMVFGSSRGDVATPTGTPAVDPNDKLAWVYDANVIVGTSGATTGPQINGSVYGSGENGHTYHDADVKIYSGTIGIASGEDIGSYSGAAYPYRGNVYGGGCGTDKYDSDNDNVKDAYNSLAGVVQGTTSVTITGGTVVHNVYGAGAMGSVGKKGTTGAIESGGTTTIAISGGTIGVSGDVDDGNVFGAARGDLNAPQGYAVVKTTNVTISQAEGKTTTIWGSVYGGGALGDVGTYTTSDGTNTFDSGSGACVVTISGGTIHHKVFGAGKGDYSTYECKKAMVNSASVTITNGTVDENVYGGGQIARVENNTVVAIGLSQEADGTTKYYQKNTDESYTEVTKAAGDNVAGLYTRSGEEDPYTYTLIEASEPVITGSVFGAGAGVETHGYSALVRGNSSVTIEGEAKVRQNVYGGGQIATVGRYKVATSDDLDDNAFVVAHPGIEVGMPYEKKSGGKCTVIVRGDAVVGPGSGDASETAGMVFGAGKGVGSDIYNSYAYTEGNTSTMPWRMTTDPGSGKRPTYYDDLGGGFIKEYYPTLTTYFKYLETLALATETDVTITGRAAVKGSVFGGSESGFVQDNTKVKIQNGTIGASGNTAYGNVFGGGKGLETFAEAGRVRGNTSVAISNGTVYGNVYGGGKLGDVGTIDKTEKDDKGNLTYNYKWKQTGGTGNNTAESNKIIGKNNNTGNCLVTITGGTIGSGSADENHGNVFGAGKGTGITWWCEKAIAYSTAVYVEDGTVYGNVYGGGQVGRVEDDARVTIGKADESGSGSKPDIKGSVFGAGAGLHTHGYSALVRGNAKVTVQGIAKVGGSVYGGGETASVGRFTVVGGLPKHPDSGGYCTVLIQDNAKIGSSGTGHDVYGACKGVDPSTISSSDRKSMQLYANRGSGAQGTDWDYYKYEENGVEKTDSRFVWKYYKTDVDYLAFLRTLALTSHPTVTIVENATVYGSVYGGGQRGITLGDVDVNITGGTVEQDVYGGGALADTNTGNWDADSYTEVTGLTAGESSVSGLYERSGDGSDSSPYIYTLTEDETAGSKTYYSKGKWADATLMTGKYKTTVKLKGGTIKGDAYGGGLGQKTGFNGATSDIAAVVWGDISVTLDGTAFEINKYTDTGYTDVVKSGRVFGCNNLNGSPQGDVTVTVNKTVAYNVSRTDPSIKVEGYGKVLLNDPNYHSTYEVAAVYGGGNLAPYKTTGKKTHVIINGCGETSIETVYGGGNAAAVPETKVDINGTYEIGTVFGGGNGKDKYKSDAGWVTNPGADVNGPTTTWIYGGTVHEAYGASNAKGTIAGNVLIDVGTVATTDPNYCKLDVGKVVGAGKDADVNGDIITILGCKPDEKIPIWYGGADNANVNGNVELTITSGNFGQVFGGNNLGGAIRGHIILNIEETGNCETPITIEKLYLGGNKAAYSRYGYYVKTTTSEGADATGVGASTETAVLTTGDNPKLILMPRTSAGDTHLPVDTYWYDEDETDPTKKWKWTTTAIADFIPYEEPQMNVISCTRIDSIYGGGYGVGGDMYADPTVNINMIPGSHAADITRAALNGAADDHRLGAIGAVFGGGDAADVIGNTTVNIGTATKVKMTSLPKVHAVEDDPEYDAELEQDAQPMVYQKETVEGAYITGSVYGGGNKADVKGNTYVNVCAKEDDDDETADVIEYAGVTVGGTGFEGVTIKGNVYGGGKGLSDSFECLKAMVGVNDTNDGTVDITKEVTSAGTSKGTRVSIGNGTVEGTVYGGGEIGRVEWNTVVKIGLPVESGKSQPVIGGNVFGAGKGVEQYGYAALVRGNTFVTIQADAKVGRSVYGGGEIASVGKYVVVNSVPTSLANQGSGYCNVTVRGNAEIGPDDMQMYHADSDGNIPANDKPDDWGHVFGAGKGILPYEDKDHFECQIHKENGHGLKHPGAMKRGTTSSPNGTWECYEGKEDKYLEFVETQALATQTEVVIGGNAFVKGSVYGGSENGHVQHGTHVTIQESCQVGAGFDKSTKKSLAKYTDWPTETEGITTSWKECAHWDYVPASGAPYDKYAIYERDGKSYYYDSDITTYLNPADKKYYADQAYTLPIYAEGGAKIAKDGHTYYGNVFGGGSGSIPYAPGKWHRAAGSVGGNTVVDITGGHILTSVYGGNEQTDVGTYTKDSNGALVVPVSEGKCTINMTGGTIGIPRTEADMKAHPVTCYLFGAGKGDQRIFFNTWTNVINTEVNIGGSARIYGSTFGGGEDGHVINNAVTNIGGTVTITDAEGTETEYPYSNVIIGTTGTSYVDGNVFGGGRGFSGDAQTAGTVGGNVDVNIYNGKMLGSIYGGGRLASVGTQFTAPTDPNYGNFLEDVTGTNAKTYGHVTVNIGGGTIGNGEDNEDVNADTDGKIVSGNVFGGSMGRLDLLNGDRNPIWPKMAQVKFSTVNIYGNAVIKRSVYGGGELGSVRDNTYVTIGGTLGTDKETVTKNGSPTVRRDVYGGGYGSLDRNYTVFTVKELENSNYVPHTYAFSPMQFAGCVGKNTYVNVAGGYVMKSVYGGGELASVGVINYRAEDVSSAPGKDKIVVAHEDDSNTWTIYSNIIKHWDKDNEFALSWPYKFEYVDGYPGKTHVKVTGGRLGLKSTEPQEVKDSYKDNGDVYGAGKGQAGDYYDYLFCANVGSTDVYIEYENTAAVGSDDDCVSGAAYGGGEDGHVMGDTKVTLKKGLIGHSVYGGGSGKGLFEATVQRIDNPSTSIDRKIYSITAGKVFGNTEVIMEDGHVVRNIYGGGNMGSVGKGNYAGGGDDYSTSGYGETTSSLWKSTTVGDNAWHFLNSGKSRVKILGGTVGYIDPSNPSNSMYPKNSSASLPYGNVFGGCRGEAAPNIKETPRYLYSPEFFVGYVNETDVIIGKSAEPAHGEPGNADYTAPVAESGPTILGSVFGGGMDGHVRRDTHVQILGGEIGIPYTSENTSKVGGITDPNNIQWLARGNVYGAGSGIGKYKYDFNYDNDYDDTYEYHGKQTKEEDYSTSAGSVTRFTKVDIQGGKIYRNVYGGGSLSSIGAPKMEQEYDEYRKGDTADGHGEGKQTLNEVIISGGQIGDANSYGADGKHVYGGHVFGGSRGDDQLNTNIFSTSMFSSIKIDKTETTSPVIYGNVYGGGEVGIVKGSVDVTMNGGTVNHDVYGGGALANTNTENPKDDSGKVTKTSDYTTYVKLLGGQIKGDAYGGALGDATHAPYVYGDVTVELNKDVAGNAKGAIVDRVFAANNANGTPKGNVTVHVYATQSEDSEKPTIAKKFFYYYDNYEDEEKTNISDVTDVTTLKGYLHDQIRKAGKLTGINVASYQATYESASDDAVVKEAIANLNADIKEKIDDPNTSETQLKALYDMMYDVRAVYGGGNEAAYVPETPWNGTSGSKSQVIIDGCGLTSIETVYGGGNAAAVPETNVDVIAAYEIKQVFGGGNGKDKKSDGSVNPGADVGVLDKAAYEADKTTGTYGTGNANSTLKGGYVHEAYGGSNQNGIIKGSINQSSDPDGSACELMMDKVVGAGKYADIDGDVNMTLDCQPNKKVVLLFAGADEANVNGNITLNITNGRFGQVFGGNNLGGAIKGKITVNVEETGCQPIKIDNLYLGSNKAAYSVFGYYESDEVHPVTGKKILKPRVSEDDEHTPVANPATDETHTFPYAQPELNIISCTYIGNVFGGGLGKEAVMYANPTVNVNMVPGRYATAVPDMMTELGLDVTKTAPNPDKLGIIENVFGGGDAANIAGNTTVNIATEEGKSAYIIGSVFGGGNAADVLGNTNVTMSGGYVFNGIFGGGYAGNVGTFTRSTDAQYTNVFGHTAHEGCIGKPISCAEGTGKCTVLVNGGQIGPISVATEGMNRSVDDGGPVPQGWVWGAGQGLVEDPAVEKDTHFKSYVGSTDVTIGGTALIMESIIGGGEFGRVLGNTLVKIEGGQIGVGAGKVDTDGKPIRYDDGDFINPSTATAAEIEAAAAKLAECSHFPYGKVINGKKEYLPYDPYYDTFKDTDYIKTDHPDLSPASTASPSDGKTWIGCVFAGGSGYMPYEKKDGSGYDWCSSAGLVEGNTNLTISGGHILTNVYGGNEVTNVKGKCKVTMTGGTIGVPRTVDQIINHPLTCYLFGAGKGDPRPHFNTETNVGEVEVEILGGIIYGSVFGGGEDGHVERNVKMTIGKDDHTGPIIGTWGTTYVDGNIFGGGRGFAGDAYTAGNVAGSVDLKIKGGTMLGSIYGGGRLGSVGYGLYPPSKGDTYYGAMRPDNTGDDDNNTAIANFKRGYVDVEISGGTIGNSYEYIIPSAANTPTGLTFANIASWTDANWKTWKTHNNIPLTEFDTETYRLKHTKGGNVFAGGMGRLYQLDGVTPITAVNWWKVGCVKQTKLTVKGGTIKSNVYGGGELGAVKPFTSGETVQGGKTEILIQNTNNTNIGSEVKDGSTTKYTFGSVFGGGYGSTVEFLGTTDDPNTENDNPKFIAGLVEGDTKVDMQGGKVLASVYGGGETASVNGSTDVKVSGGEVGKSGFGGATMGNVYGGGSGHRNIVRCGRILKNAKVAISGTDTKIYHNVYGGGAYGTVGDFDYEQRVDPATGAVKVFGVIDLKTPGTGKAEVIITGGTIGVDGHENGMVFGSSRGDVNKPGERDDHTAWVYNSFVTIGAQGAETGPSVKGSVYGSGENGHTFNDTDVKVHSGTIGVAEDASYLYRGNVYGGGCGTDKYYLNPSSVANPYDGNGDKYNPLAGIVYGNTKVTMDGGHVVHNVYGAGAMGSVGKMEENATTHTISFTSGGKTTIAISGGTIGVDGNENGNVYGAARGDLDATDNGLALVRETEVDIKPNSIDGKPEAKIWGSVYGGGEIGNVGTYTTDNDGYNIYPTGSGVCSVEITGGEIHHNVFGAGKGSATTFACEKAMVSTSSVSISNGNVYGNVYGGGEVGRVENDTQVTIGTSGGDAPEIDGSVFGAGAGKETHGYSALVRGNTFVTVQGNAKVGKNVYGGGEVATVGRYKVVDDLPTEQLSGGVCSVIVKGDATIGSNGAAEDPGHVFGAGKGVKPNYIATGNDKSKKMNGNGEWESFASEADYLSFLETLALATNTFVTIGDKAKVKGSVYGGSESGFVQHHTSVAIMDNSEIGTTGSSYGNIFGGGLGVSENESAGRVRENTTVTIIGGTMHGSVYGGGALGKANTLKASNTTSVNLLGGTIEGEAFGGGLGDKKTAANVGNTKVNLNGMSLSEYNSLFSGLPEGDFKTLLSSKLSSLLTLRDVNVNGATTDEGVDYYLVSGKGCVVNRVFGANNINGTPTGHAKVHVHATQNKDIAHFPTISDKSGTDGVYDMTAVYGGGKQADYVPAITDALQSTEVIIEGCDLTSIKEVYGGGYGAATPGTNVLVKGTKIIDNLFGGGYGAGDDNPGANVGFRSDGTTSYGNDGKAVVQLMAGTVNHVYGGSNTKGNIRGGSNVTSIVRGSNDLGPACCEKLTVLDIFGGGKSAPMFGGAEIVLGCMPNDWVGAIYGGAEAADVKNDVSLTLTSGKFGRVFGGNKSSGVIEGYIEVNIEENPDCDVPIIIGELYGGGDRAPYNTPDKYLSKDPNYQSPRVNVRAFTSIGNIFGGGYGDEAVVTGNPMVNINEVAGGREYVGDDGDAKKKLEDGTVVEIYKTLSDDTEEGTKVTLYPRYTGGKMGVIGNVFGGGNAAAVVGSTYVNIGTTAEEPFVSLPMIPVVDGNGDPVYEVDQQGKPVYESDGTTRMQKKALQTKLVVGADIRGNVYGGGNNAGVTGDTNVVIGKEKVTTP